MQQSVTKQQLPLAQQFPPEQQAGTALDWTAYRCALPIDAVWTAGLLAVVALTRCFGAGEATQQDIVPSSAGVEAGAATGKSDTAATANAARNGKRAGLIFFTVILLTMR